MLKFGFFQILTILGCLWHRFLGKCYPLKNTNSHKSLLGHPLIPIQKEFTFRIRLAELFQI
jgi:hypothetical protein